MEKKLLKYSNLVTLILFAIALIVRFKFALGLLIGQTFYDAYFILLVKSMDRKLTKSKADIWTILLKIFRILLLGIPMLFAFLWPNIFEIIGVMLGLLMFKIITILSALKKEK